MKSAPIQCAALGRASDSAESVCKGSQIVIRSANSAPNTNTLMMMAPAAPRGWRRMKWRKAPRNPLVPAPARFRSAAKASAISIPESLTVIGASIGIFDARVERRVSKIDEEIHHDDDDGDEHHQVLHDRI